MKTPEGILGLAGREPIGAVVSLGIKGDRGFPIERDRFHIVVPREESGKRPHDPAFAAFNGSAVPKRQKLLGNIVHATADQCFEFHLKAQVLGKGYAHPDKRPACVGNGVRAVRWMRSDADDFLEIECPNDRCQYRQTTPPACKPFARLLFQLRWPEGYPPMPTPLVKFTTGSWNSTANLKGFFDYIHSAALSLGLDQYTLFGLPFAMSVQLQTKASAKTAFPVVRISPEINPVEWFLRQQEQIAALHAAPRYEAITDQSQQDSDLIYQDVKSISVPGGK